MNEPLAIKLRPTKLSEVIGQDHLIGKDKILSNLVLNKKLFSMILYGRPGIGKTSIALALINELHYKYRILNAVINNKKDFDIFIEEAKMNNGMVLVMDEIHRLNKDKQDLLLPYLESGLVILIGMTTSNPYHSINPAIRSRCQIFKLNELSSDDITKAIKKACKSEYLPDIKIDKDAINYIVGLSGTDLRYAYNLLEMAYYNTLDHKITVDVISNISSRPNIYHDKDADTYYDLLSALQKSIRGSDVHASIYYLARLIAGGDLDAICRRLSVIVYEDIGLANPSLGPRVMAAIDAALGLGVPEARIPLSEVVIEMALSPKSNSSIMAIDKALSDIESGASYETPSHIKTSSRDYKYPHNYKNSYVRQQYLPDKIKDNKYYFPKNNKNEIILKDIMDKLDKIE